MIKWDPLSCQLVVIPIFGRIFKTQLSISFLTFNYSFIPMFWFCKKFVKSKKSTPRILVAFIIQPNKRDEEPNPLEGVEEGKKTKAIEMFRTN